MKDRLLSLADTVAVSTIVGTVCVIAVGVVVFTLAVDGGEESEQTAGVGVDGGPSSTVELLPVDPATEGQVTGGQADEAEPEPSAPFYVVGSDIVDPDGNLFIPVGVNAGVDVVGFPFVFNGGNGGVDGRVDEIKAWGWNTVRANLACAGAEGVTQSQVQDGIRSAIEELTAAGIVVIITCHDGGGTNITINDENEEILREFWDVVAEEYRDNPHVWFNFFNEPWALRGGDGALDDWLTLQEFYIRRYRNKGVENIVVADIPGFAQAIDLLADDPFADGLSAECNVVFGWHAWGDLAGEQATADDYRVKALAARAKNLAIVITEAGVPDPLDAGTAGLPEWNVSGYEGALELATDEQFGLLWWHGTGDTTEELFYPLTADATGFWTAADGTNLSDAGQSFWEFSQRERTPTAFDGSLIASGCPSVTGTEG